MFRRTPKNKPTVAFATTCWEKDWRIVLERSYLEKMIFFHRYPFSEVILIINNVENAAQVYEKALEQNVFTKIVFSQAIEEKVFSFFSLEKGDFRMGEDATMYENVTPSWIYYNALGPLSALFALESDYLLYVTGDVWLEEPLSWIDRALSIMERSSTVKVANLTWNGRYDEAKKEAYRKSRHFFFSKKGFSDQMFLVKREDFQKPIYSEIREDSQHFPRGDVFEKRVYSYLLNRGFERITFRRGSYIHTN